MGQVTIECASNGYIVSDWFDAKTIAGSKIEALAVVAMALGCGGPESPVEQALEIVRQWDAKLCDDEEPW